MLSVPVVFLYCHKRGDIEISLDHQYVLEPQTMAHGQSVTVVSPLLAANSETRSSVYSKLESTYNFWELYVPLDALQPAFKELKDRVVAGQGIAGSPVAAVNAKVNHTNCGRLRIYPVNTDQFNASLFATAVYTTRTHEYSAAQMTAKNGTPMYTPVSSEQHRANVLKFGGAKRSQHSSRSGPEWVTNKLRTPNYTAVPSQPSPRDHTPQQQWQHQAPTANRHRSPPAPFQQVPQEMQPRMPGTFSTLQSQAPQSPISNVGSSTSNSEASGDTACRSGTPDSVNSKSRSATPVQPGLSWNSVAKIGVVAATAAAAAATAKPV